MEELLNKLIKRGWKPFGITCIDFIKGTGLEGIPSYCFNPHPHMGFPGGTRKYHRPSLRQIVSRESGLWQYVCKNRMIIDEHYCWDGCIHGDDNGRIEIWQNDYRYRLIEASLKDDSELEDFLLSNIVIKDEK